MGCFLASPPFLPSCPPRRCPLCPFQEVPCNARRCLGSVMVPKQMLSSPDGARSEEELLLLARDFITLYYSSMKR